MTGSDRPITRPVESQFVARRNYAPALQRTIGFNTHYRTHDVAKNLGKYFSCAERTVQRKDCALILTLKMETRHPVDDQFGRDFPEICNYWGYDGLMSQDLEILLAIFAFFG